MPRPAGAPRRCRAVHDASRYAQEHRPARRRWPRQSAVPPSEAGAMSSDRTTLERAGRGYDAAHERQLVAAITGTIAEVSVVSDANALVLRSSEITAALLTVLAGVLAMSP